LLPVVAVGLLEESNITRVHEFTSSRLSLTQAA
jgi:hypothetical protein